MISRNRLLLGLFLAAFFAVSFAMIALRTRFNQAHFQVGRIPTDVLSRLQPKTIPLASMHPPALRLQDPVRFGAATSVLSVVEYGDFQCEYCRAMKGVIDRVLLTYQGKVRFVWRDTPLSNHSEALPAAVFARCAALQNAFWGAYDELMTAAKLNESAYQAAANRLHLDPVALKSCRANPAVSTLITTDAETAQADGIQSAPFLFVGTKAFDGYIDEETLHQAIDEQLSSL